MSNRFLHFAKYTGAGNDFVMIDDRKESFPHSTKFIKHLCCRRNGIGADGLILLQESSSENPRMRIFNADGSEAEMCGNGLRCFNKFAMECGYTKNPLYVAAKERTLLTTTVDEDVEIEMGEIGICEIGLNLTSPIGDISADFIHTGVPHLVCYLESLEQIDVSTVGAYFRNHPQFQPSGTNVNFITRSKEIRTYERGVEAETWACGTGCAAAAVSLFLRNFEKPPISLRTRGGELLTVDFLDEAGIIRGLRLKGPARKVFSGQFEIQ